MVGCQSHIVQVRKIDGPESFARFATYEVHSIWWKGLTRRKNNNNEKEGGEKQKTGTHFHIQKKK